MKNWISWCLICFWAFASLAAQAQGVPPAPLALSDAAQDSSGQMWGLTPLGPRGLMVPDGPASGLCRWSGGWHLAPPPEGVTGQPHALGRMPSGAVICLWDSGSEHLLTAHRGAVSRLVTRFKGFVSSPRLFGDTSGNVWVTSLGGDIYRIPARLGTTDQPEHAYAIADADYYPGYQKSNEGPDQGREAGLHYHDPLLAAEDSRGRMWFWTDRLAGADNFAALRGLLRWENGRMVHYASLGNLPDKPLDWVAPRGPGHLWICVHNGGAYDVDTETLRGTPVPEPERFAFQSVQETFAIGTDWYVVAGFASNLHPGTLTSTLWRQRAGVWRKLLDGMDTQALSQDFTTRPILKTSAGLWIGSYGTGAWLLPSSAAPPLRLDWRYGYSLSDTTRLYSLPAASGGVVALKAGINAGPALPQTHLETRLARAPSGAIRTLTTSHPLVQDSRGHVWNLDARPGAYAPDAHAALSEWDGKAWIPHPLPPDAVPALLAALALDSRNRLWLLPWPSAGPKAPVFVYDPPGQSWQTFPSFDAALLAQLNSPDPPIVDIRDRAPAFNADGRVAYRTDDWHLHFFDGHVWHDWTAKDLGRPDLMQFAFNSPFFNKGGLLCVNPEMNPSSVDKDTLKTLVWTEADGWKPTVYAAGPNDFSAQSAAGQIVFPALPVTPDAGSAARDHLGALWFTSDGVLYRANSDGCKAVFPPELPTPFVDGRRIFGAMTDPKGNTFLDTFAGQAREYVLVMKPIPPGGV